MTISILLGAPGVGKGTVAAVIAEPLKAAHISTGAMLREAVKKGTPAGIAAKKNMDAGELVPDSVLIEMIGELLDSAGREAAFILDGFPRTVPQAEALEALAQAHGTTVAKVICLDVPEDVIMDRLSGRRICPKCGAGFHVRNLPPKREGVCDACGSVLATRVDDQPETIRNRLAVYERQTAPLVTFYAKAGKLIHVDASGSVEDNVERVLGCMQKIL